MQGLWITSALGLFLLSACAQEKFQDQGQQTHTSSTFPQDTAVEGEDEDAVDAENLPAEVMETTPGSDPVSIQKPLFTDCQTTPDRPIVGDLYQLTPDTKTLPDYSKMKAIKKICLSQLDIKTRNFSEGFPGVEKLFEWFSLDLHFSVKVPKSGKWEFKLVADDGAILVIDHEKVVDNDGVHQTQEKNGRTQLTAGMHDFRVSYFQGPRYNIALELYWKGPNDREFSYIPAAQLMRPRATRLMSVAP